MVKWTKLYPAQIKYKKVFAFYVFHRSTQGWNAFVCWSVFISLNCAALPWSPIVENKLSFLTGRAWAATIRVILRHSNKWFHQSLAACFFYVYINTAILCSLYHCIVSLHMHFRDQFIRRNWLPSLNRFKWTKRYLVDGVLVEVMFQQVSTMTLARRGCEGEFMDRCSRMDVTQSEGDLPDSTNQRTRNANSTPIHQMNSYYILTYSTCHACHPKL